MAERVVLLHAHLFKNGGTTFDWALKRNFRKNFLEHRKGREMSDGGFEYLLSTLERDSSIEALSSHSLPFPLEDVEGYKLLPVFFIRNPILRTKSIYTFERRQRKMQSPGAKFARKSSFEEYVAWRLLKQVGPVMRNFHTLYLSGGVGRVKRSITQKSFSVAKANIAKSPMVGLVEKYDESMVCFEEYLRPYFPAIDLAYISQNVSKGKEKNSAGHPVFSLLGELSPDLRQQLLDANEFDMKLYTYTRKLLDKRISAIDNFDDRLVDFQKRCKRLSA